MYCPDIVDFLAQHGLGYDYAKLSNKVDDQYCDSSRVTGELEFGHLARREMSIVFLPPSDDDPVGHYLTCYAGKYMDPWANRHEKYNLKVRAEFIDKLPRNPNWVIFAK